MTKVRFKEPSFLGHSRRKSTRFWIPDVLAIYNLLLLVDSDICHTHEGG